MNGRHLIFLLLLTNSQVSAGVGLGLHAGLWKPSSLDTDPGNPFATLQGSGPSYGVLLLTPTWQGFAVQLSAWGWHYSIDRDDHEIAFLHLAVDIKHLLLTQTRLRPYATYGVAWLWGNEQDVALKRAGLSVNIGAGLEGSLTQHWSVGVEYQYLYLILQRSIGSTDNYSGPKLTVKLFHLF